MQQLGRSSTHRLDSRGLASLFMFFSFLWLVPTGIIMHFAAQGSSESVLHIVMSMHNTASVIFVTSVVVHLILNRKSMSRYMLSKMREYLPFRTEMIIAAVAVIVLVLLVGSHALHGQ